MAHSPVSLEDSFPLATAEGDPKRASETDVASFGGPLAHSCPLRVFEYHFEK